MHMALRASSTKLPPGLLPGDGLAGFHLEKVRLNSGLCRRTNMEDVKALKVKNTKLSRIPNSITKSPVQDIRMK